MELENHDIMTEQRTPPIPLWAEWALLVLLGLVLGLTLASMKPEPKPLPMTPRVAQLLGWCEATEGK